MSFKVRKKSKGVNLANYSISFSEKSINISDCHLLAWDEDSFGML